MVELGLTHVGFILIHTLYKCNTVVLSRTDGRQNALAKVWRHSGRLEHLHGILPGSVAAGLRIRPRVDFVFGSSPPGGDSFGDPGFALVGAAGYVQRARRPAAPTKS